MAKKVVKSGLSEYLKKQGADQAVVAHRADETDYGSAGNLPPGIEGGVAQLVAMRFDKYKRGNNTGKYFWYASGVVKEPKVHNGQHVAGLQTRIMEPMCPTPNRSRPDVESHLAWVMNEMRKLGYDTSDLTANDLDQAAADLVELAPHFRFRTWQSNPTKEFPNPRTNETWLGYCEYVDEDGVIDVVDDTEPEDLLSDEEEPEEEEEEGVEEEEEAEEEEEEEQEEEAEEEEEEEEDEVPAKGAVVMFKPPKSKRAIECEVKRVLVSKRLVDLASLDDGRLFKGVGWDELA